MSQELLDVCVLFFFAGHSALVVAVVVMVGCCPVAPGLGGCSGATTYRSGCNNVGRSRVVGPQAGKEKLLYSTYLFSQGGLGT